MTPQEFLKKATDIRNELMSVLWEIEAMDGYVYQQAKFVQVHGWIEEHIHDMEYELKNLSYRIEQGQKMDGTLQRCMEEYERYLANAKDWLRTTKAIKFTEPR